MTLILQGTSLLNILQLQRTEDCSCLKVQAILHYETNPEDVFYMEYSGIQKDVGKEMSG